MMDAWARRKAAVAKETEAELAALRSVEAAQAEAALAERSDEEILAAQDLPEPEALDSAEAVREFLGSAVPQRLKTRALRQLWKLNPVLANLDGLVDYGEDFTDAATVIENLQTAYQVGKGMLAHTEALAEAEAAKAEAEDAAKSEALAQAEQEAPDHTQSAAAPEADQEAPGHAQGAAAPEVEHKALDHAQGAAAPEADQEAPGHARAPRRMTFQFESHA